MAAEYVAGLGRITAIAADLDSEMFANWPDRLSLITQTTGKVLIPREDENNRKSRATAYDDLGWSDADHARSVSAQTYL